MIQLIARIFQDGNIIGYQATDGQQTRNLTKQEAWAYAKQNKILNVEASGTLQNPSLSGTNGFQLKTLPELKTSGHSIPKKSNNPFDGVRFQQHDLYASIVRIFTANPLTTHVKETTLLNIGKDALKNDLNSGVLNKNTFKIYRDNIAVTAVLKYNTSHKALGGITVGYIIKNIGDTPIFFNRVLSEPLVITNDTVTINPGCDVPISSLELNILMSKPEFSGAISNAKLDGALGSNEVVSNIRSIIRHFYIISNNGNAGKLDNLVDSIDIFNYASKEEYEIYYKRYATKEIELL